jgi:hypothetical protein
MTSAQDEVAALRQQLQEKDEQIKALKAQEAIYQCEGVRVETAINNILQQLIESTPSTNISKVNELESITRETDRALQVAALVQHLQQESNQVVARLVSQLQGHVDFLVKLSSSPDLLSLFLVPEVKEPVFLPKHTANLLREQAAQTSTFLAGFRQRKAESPGNIDELLSLDVDCRDRRERIARLVETPDIPVAELRVLFLQEVLITSALRRYVAELLKRGGDYDLQPQCQCAFRALKEALDDSDTKLGMKGFLALATVLAEKVIHAREANGMTAAQFFATDQCAWATWARRLYSGLTRLSADGVTDGGLRIVIEEAGLTAVGTQVLQKRLKSLRFQKAVMQPPEIETSKEIGFMAVVVAGRATARLLKAVGHLPALSGFRTVTRTCKKRPCENTLK